MLVTSTNVFDYTVDMRLGCARGLTYEVKEGKSLSSEFQRRFHAHLSQCASQSGVDRDKLKLQILRQCVDEHRCVDGGSLYPYTLVDVKLQQPIGDITHIEIQEPLSTSQRTNKEMMTAYDCLQEYATKHGIILNERGII